MFPGVSSLLGASSSRSLVPRASLPRASMVGLRAFRDQAASMEARMALAAKNTPAPQDAVGFVVSSQCFYCEGLINGMDTESTSLIIKISKGPSK